MRGVYAHAAPVHTRARDCPIIMSDYFIGHAIKILPSIDGRNGRCEALVVSGAEWSGWVGSLNKLCEAGRATHPRMLFITGDRDDHLDDHRGQTVNSPLNPEGARTRDHAT